MTNRIADEATSTDLRGDLDRLREDVRKLREDLSAIAHDTAEVARGRARVVRDRLDERVSAAAAEGREMMQNFAEQVEHHPLASLVTAFATGLAAGLLLPRQR